MVTFPNMLGIDTFAWYKFIELYKDKWKDLMVRFLIEYKVFITNDVKKEFQYRFPDFEHLLEKITIEPRRISNISYDHKIFDQADISLLEYAELNGYVIITEDHAMLGQGVTKRRNIIQFCDLITLLYENNLVSSSDFNQIIKKLRKMKNITKTKENELNKIRLQDNL